MICDMCDPILQVCGTCCNVRWRRSIKMVFKSKEGGRKEEEREGRRVKEGGRDRR